MLGKLIKHEFKTTSKLILPLYLVIIVITIFARIAAQGMISEEPIVDSGIMAVFIVLSMITYILGMFAVCVAVYIYLIMRFYKNLFSDEGYLMHTLPVTSMQLLISKLVTAFVWYLIEAILVFLSIFCTFATRYALDATAEFFGAYGGFPAFITYITGMSFPGFCLFIIVAVIISLLSGFLLPYASICVGQLWQQHKVAGAFLTYFITNFVVQIITTVLSGLFFDMDMIDSMDFVPMQYYGFTIGVSAVIAVASFLVCEFIMKRKINLD